MRNLNRNKQTLWYALYGGKVTKYKLDENGDKIISFIDDETTPPTEYYEEEGEKDVYLEYNSFFGHIALSGGDTQNVEFGVSQANYSAILITEKNSIPIAETSLIWANTEPTIDSEGYTDPSTADYTVVKVSPSINEDKYILSKVVKNNG